MDKTEAQFILQAWRPGGHDASDPAFAAALAQVASDPELAAWFEEQRALDAVIAAKLQSFPVPARLKPDILAGRKIVRPSAFQSRRNLLAMAAAIAALLSLAVWWSPSQRADRHVAAAFQADMGRFLNGIGHLDFHTEDVSKARHWLANNAGHDALRLPPRLEGQPCVGCRVLDWEGSKVSLVCYYLKATGDGGSDGRTQIEELHLLVIDRDRLKDMPAAAAPRFSTQGRWETALWSDGRHAYLLAGLAQGGYLKKYFDDPPADRQGGP